jgi:hypothetical protein
VIEASWSRDQEEDCIRIRGLRPLAKTCVRTEGTGGVANLPTMAGRFVRAGSDVNFVPRFPFVDGMTYVVEVAGQQPVRLLRPRVERAPNARVVAIRPSARELPCNVLRVYVWFSTPMSEGYAADHVAFVGQDGQPLEGLVLPGAYELWDPDHRRLTILMDPARIKRGLPSGPVPYPLYPGGSFQIVVKREFADHRGAIMIKDASRHFRVVSPLLGRVDPLRWRIGAPRLGSVDALTLGFDRPLDHGLLLRCMRITDPEGAAVAGVVSVEEGEYSWRFVPTSPWGVGEHRCRVDPELEDVAGNSVSHVFDRDRSERADDPLPPNPVWLTFQPSRAS